MLGSLKASIRKEVERHRNRPFLEATMAASALVAIADGKVTFSERHRIDQILENLEELRIFDVHEAIDLLNRHLERLGTSPRSGKTDALAAVTKIKDDPDAGRLLIKICVSISNADGDFSAAEHDQVDEICAQLGHTLAEAGV